MSKVCSLGIECFCPNKDKKYFCPNFKERIIPNHFIEVVADNKDRPEKHSICTNFSLLSINFLEDNLEFTSNCKYLKTIAVWKIRMK